MSNNISSIAALGIGWAAALESHGLIIVDRWEQKGWVAFSARF